MRISLTVLLYSLIEDICYIIFTANITFLDFSRSSILTQVLVLNFGCLTVFCSEFTHCLTPCTGFTDEIGEMMNDDRPITYYRIGLVEYPF